MGLTSTGQLLSRWKHRDGMGSKMCQGKLGSQGKLLCSIIGAESGDAVWGDAADTSSVGSFKGVRRTGYCDRIYVSKTIRCSSRHMLQRVTMTLLRDAWGCIEWLEWSTGNACVVTTLSVQICHVAKVLLLIERDWNHTKYLVVGTTTVCFSPHTHIPLLSVASH